MYVCCSLMYVCCSLMYVCCSLMYVIMFVFILAYTWQQSHDRNRTLVRYYVLQSRTNVWDLTKVKHSLLLVIHNVIQRSTKLSTSYPQPNPKLSTRIINVVNRFNVRQTIINVALKRFTDDIRTIRSLTVSNVRKSYPQVIHR